MSYIARTNDWDEFPNGRWGVSRSPAFGDITDYPSMSKYVSSTEKHIKMWGQLESESDIGKLIIKFITGEIKRLPWSETSVAQETGHISDFVKLMNENNFFTTNSQPKVNGVKSSDNVFGWGPQGGYVYQKAYIEFLVPERVLLSLIKHLNKYPSISY